MKMQLGRKRIKTQVRFRITNNKNNFMSIEMKNPQTKIEKADAAANWVEQMFLAHSIKDEDMFKNAHEQAGKLLFNLTRDLEEE
jgi:hypothetical protein